MASSHSSAIPRFLLPQAGRIWQRANLGNRLRSPDLPVVRHASSISKDAKGKPIVLEKPERFNPPSHGARLPNKNRPQQFQHYGGSLSPEDQAAQRRREYPGLPAPEGTWDHWFWHNRALHMTITMGTLAGLALYTLAENFKHTTPFADMLPSSSDYRERPLASLHTLYEVWKLTQLHESTVVAAKRKRTIDDVAKRAEYRKAHGLKPEGSWGKRTARTDADAPPPPEPGKREKWLGIF